MAGIFNPTSAAPCTSTLETPGIYFSFTKQTHPGSGGKHYYCICWEDEIKGTVVGLRGNFLNGIKTDMSHWEKEVSLSLEHPEGLGFCSW